MNEPIKPPTLPMDYRPKQSEPPWTVRRLDPSRRGFTAPEAIRIDRGWGVWLDLNAPVKFAPPHSPPPQGYPILVTVHHVSSDGRVGYAVDLGFVRGKQTWTPSLMELFDVEGLRQFVPVFQVC